MISTEELGIPKQELKKKAFWSRRQIQKDSKAGVKAEDLRILKQELQKNEEKIPK